jgi:hypothetical protein
MKWLACLARMVWSQTRSPMGKFLNKNIKTLIHIRRRHRDNMLGLCLGAGVSVDFAFPTWPALIERIADHQAVRGRGLLKVSGSLTSQLQFLFQMYKQGLYAQDPTGDSATLDRQANAGWLKVIHECLYRNAKTNDEHLKTHPYLWALVPLVRNSAMTVNYNFDDTVERMLYLRYASEISASDDRGFEVGWQPAIQFRRQKGVIYHPNGFLPLNTSDGMSDAIVFMEEEFADQLIDVAAGHYACLLNHFTKQTLIFVGLSLNDTTLKHLLRVAARGSPGHFHYHVHWCRDEKPSAAEQKAIREANFRLYNLVTLFLNSDEISTFARLILEDKQSFDAECDKELQGVKTEYRYYITGSVGCGKTTTVGQVRSLDCFEEWVDRKHSLLHRPHEELQPAQRKEVDEWINQQFRKKNRRISQAGDSIAVIDRTPLDPLYFSKDAAAAKLRAHELLQWMVPANSSVKKIAAGHLIILTCERVILLNRLASRDKPYKDDQLKAHQALISKFWDGEVEASIIDTTNLTVSQVVKRLLSIILFDEYKEVDFHGMCTTRSDAA